ncbi:MAG: putative metal-dependent hydrolase [Balneolaceae bacterium]
MKDIRYPIGRFEHTGPVTDDDLNLWISQIEMLPEQVSHAVKDLTDDQLDTPYRERGWTLRQVIHHIPDSHLNSYIRFKWALTEDEPVIKVYEQERWADLQDYKLTPVQISLDFLSSLHAKWVILLRSLSPEQLSMKFIHPDSGPTALSWNIGNYAWHGRHHLAHITHAIQREGW